MANDVLRDVGPTYIKPTRLFGSPNERSTMAKGELLERLTKNGVRAAASYYDANYGIYLITTKVGLWVDDVYGGFLMHRFSTGIFTSQISLEMALLDEYSFFFLTYEDLLAFLIV